LDQSKDRNIDAPPKAKAAPVKDESDEYYDDEEDSHEPA
jgi:hypothetical protein|tara:strand:+ start:598 stop:714 length:117 start_codon:yes stop_codon:yes gene_type:complete